MNISPKKVLHVGDSVADIIGAKAAGIDSCLINQTHREWTHSIQPDYTITQLSELFEFL